MNAIIAHARMDQLNEQGRQWLDKTQVIAWLLKCSQESDKELSFIFTGLASSLASATKPE